jgi:hypothetical protein
MFSKATTCLLLTLALITLAVPAFADGNPPPVGDGNIHPWDNNDGGQVSKGPYIVSSGWIWMGFGHHAGFIYVPRSDASKVMKSNGSMSNKALRTTEVQVATRTR